MDTNRPTALRREKQQTVLILARGDKVSHVRLRPWMAIAGLGFAALITTGYIGSAAYLFFRDDLFAATLAHQKRVQNDYEERIAALRVQVDNLTSRQYRDQQLVETSVARILDKQKELAERDEKLSALLQKSDALNLIDQTSELEDKAVLHSYAPASKASMGAINDPFEKLLNSPSAPLKIAPSSKGEKNASLANQAETILSQIHESLETLEQRQKARINEIAVAATRKADELHRVLASTGLRPSGDDTVGVGGPYAEPVSFDQPFDNHLVYLDQSLSEFNKLKATAETLPFGQPAPGKRITSRFGNRVDPFFGRLALHAGIDFEARTGDSVHAAGAGKVTHADYSGGYGKMVEVEHENGYSTRYGHLSRIDVREGDVINAGDVIGKAGNTGRSTGPHVHYEIRHKDRALDPMRFISAGKKIEPLLKAL